MHNFSNASGFISLGFSGGGTISLDAEIISSSLVNNSLFTNFLETDRVFCLWLLFIMNNFRWRSYCFAVQSLAELY